MSMQIEQATLVAPDISCGHCVATIQKVLRALDGVRRVDANVETRQVTIAFDPAHASLARIEAALDEEGYTVRK